MKSIWWYKYVSQTVLRIFLHINMQGIIKKVQNEKTLLSSLDRNFYLPFVSFLAKKNVVINYRESIYSILQ